MNKETITKMLELTNELIEDLTQLSQSDKADLDTLFNIYDTVTYLDKLKTEITE